MSLEEDSAPSCPLCYEHLISGCGHSICKDCALMKKSHICDICRFINYSTAHYEGRNNTGSTVASGKKLLSSEWPTNFTMIELIEAHASLKKELRRQKRRDKLAELSKTFENRAEEKIDKLEDSHRVQCVQCSASEDVDTVVVCVGCATKKWRSEEDCEKRREHYISSYVLCSRCWVDHHFGHKLVKYNSWILKTIMVSAIGDSQAPVLRANEMCTSEMDTRRELGQQWLMEMHRLCSLPCNDSQQEPTITKSVEKTCEEVGRATEDLLSEFQCYNGILKESLEKLISVRNNQERKFS